MSFYPKTKLYKKDGAPIKFVFGNPHGRVSLQSTVLPIWTTDSFRPARVRLIEGKKELLLLYNLNKPAPRPTHAKTFLSGNGGRPYPHRGEDLPPPRKPVE